MFNWLKNLFQSKPDVNLNHALMLLQEAHIRLLRDYSNQIAHLRAAQKGLRRLQRKMKRVLREQHGQGISGSEESLFDAPADAPEPDVSTLPSLFVNGVFFARLTAEYAEPTLVCVQPKYDWLEPLVPRPLTHNCVLDMLVSTISGKVSQEEASYSIVAGGKTYTVKANLVPSFTRVSLRNDGIQRIRLCSRSETFYVEEHEVSGSTEYTPNLQQVPKDSVFLSSVFLETPKPTDATDEVATNA